MTKTIILALFALMVSGMVRGQGKEKKVDNKTLLAEKILDSILEVRANKIDKNKLLVSPEVFKQIIQNDFSKVQTAATIENITNRYASVNVDGEKQNFFCLSFCYSFWNQSFNKRKI